MRDYEFERFLQNLVVEKTGEPITDKAIKSRLSKCRKVEKDYNVDLDIVVKSPEHMRELSEKLLERTKQKDDHGVYLNAVRKYFEFVNGYEAPKNR
jgi:site-specific recombinase XerC